MTDAHSVIFGCAALKGDLSHLVRDSKCLIITSKGAVKRGAVESVRHSLKLKNFEIYTDIKSLPSIADCLRIRDLFLKESIEVILALGGGSVMDVGKLTSWLLAQRDRQINLQNFMSEAKNISSVLPLIAVPTTGGTGSEVTPFATLWDIEDKKKISIESFKLIPLHAIVDPELTLTLPGDVALYSALDALTQCFESIWNKNFTEEIYEPACEGISLILSNLELLKAEPTNLLIRTNLSKAALLSGLCIRRTRTALCHSISYPLTAHFEVPHGLACGFILPEVMAWNLAIDCPQLEKLSAELKFNSAAELCTYLKAWLKKFDLDSALMHYCKNRKNIENLASEMLTPGRANNNWHNMTSDEIGPFIKRKLNELRTENE